MKNYYKRTRRMIVLALLLITASLGNHIISTPQAAATTPSAAATAATVGGRVVAWGLNGDGQSTVPAELSDVTAIAAGNAHSLALKSDGTVVAWGSNANGLLNIPARLSGVTAIAAGTGHNLALTTTTNAAPVAVCKNITVSAGASCTATVTAAQVNNGSYDPDAGDSISLSLDSTGPFGLGNHPVTLTVTDSNGASSSATATVTVADTTNPVISCPSNVVAYLPLNSTDTGVVVNYPTPTATDCSSVNITTSKASGSTFLVGTTTVNVTATDAAGNQSTCSFTVTVPYDFSGFFQPVDNLPAVNVANAGSAIPVKFSLNGNKGITILAAGFPTSQPFACGGGTPDDVEETSTATTSGLSYNATTDTYTYVWKTDRAWKGTCRQLDVKLNDGTSHVANFQFK